MDEHNAAGTPLQANTHGLQRRLTGRQLSMIGLGGAIGTGLFLGSSLAISQAGPSTIIAYIVCGLVALIIAWALAEMVVVHPTAGAFGVLAHSYVGRWAGFVVRWTYWAIQCIAIGGEVIAAGIFVRFWWPDIPLWLSTVVFSVAILAVNAAAVNLFGKIEYWFAMIKVSAIVAFILLGLALLFFGLPGQAPLGLGKLTSDGGFMPNGIQGLLLAMVFVIFSFIGTEVVSVTAAESENPGRDVVRATRSMALRLTLFYVVAISIVLTVVPWTQTAQAGGNITASPFVMVFSAANIPAAATIMNFVVLTAALSSANANLYLTTRMMHSLAAHKYAPAWAGKLTKRGAPAMALILSSIGLVIAAVISVVAADTAYLALFGISVFGALVVWILILITHMRFRFVRARHGLPQSPARLAGAPLTTILALLFLVAVLVSTLFIEGLTWTWVAGVPFFVALLIAYYFVDKRTAGNHRYDPLREEIEHAQPKYAPEQATAATD
ncbi:L-asparagine transporter-like permease [Arthrobacter sp. 1088]|uniref:amino acid permease n=1 Tax=Arthrobacter sp. 1088 TaxID=2817768 RepID=UPI0028550555|nr:amino acid permease [Arthrobacter sp. 1088]MDR6687736.1 L-asparagine transporter-like permease [Arthrobacter sp. 1088]